LEGNDEKKRRLQEDLNAEIFNVNDFKLKTQYYMLIYVEVHHLNSTTRVAVDSFA